MESAGYRTVAEIGRRISAVTEKTEKPLFCFTGCLSVALQRLNSISFLGTFCKIGPQLQPFTSFVIFKPIRLRTGRQIYILHPFYIHHTHFMSNLWIHVDAKKAWRQTYRSMIPHRMI